MDRSETPGLREDPQQAIAVEFLARVGPFYGQATVWKTMAQDGTDGQKSLDRLAARVEGLWEAFVLFCMDKDVVPFVVLQTYAPQAIEQLNGLRDFLPETAGDAVIRQQATDAFDQVWSKAVT